MVVMGIGWYGSSEQGDSYVCDVSREGLFTYRFYNEMNAGVRPVVSVPSSVFSNP